MIALLEQGVPPSYNRGENLDDDQIRSLERKAERLEEEAEDLREDARRIDAEADSIWEKVKALRDKKAKAKDDFSEFFEQLLQADLTWAEIETVNAAREGEFCKAELLSLALRYSVSAPRELFPQLSERRAR